MSLQSVLEDATGPHALTPSTPSAPSAPSAPSVKALGKRKMTERQLAAYYAKLPRTNDYDSDDAAQHPTSTIHSHNPQMTFDIQMALEVRRDQENRPPVNVASEDEHARDLLEALNGGGYSPVHDCSLKITPEDIEDLLADNHELDPGRLVPDPFGPNECPHMTAAERDAMVNNEQVYRENNGMALLVQSEDDPDHWIEDPAQPDGTVVKIEEIDVSPLFAVISPALLTGAVAVHGLSDADLYS